MKIVNETFTCGECKRELKTPDTIGTGYAREPFTERLICYDCCAVKDVKNMCDTGRIVLYLTAMKYIGFHETWEDFHICNFPNTLRFYCTQSPSITHHNIAGKRLDIWFIGPDGARWHGVSFGDNQICRCNRLKRQKKHLIFLPVEAYLKPYPYAI